MNNIFHTAKKNIANAKINESFFTSLDYVFKGLISTGIGVWVASVLQIMFVSPWLSIPIILVLMFTTMQYAKVGKDTKAALTFYLFSFIMGVFLYSSLYVFSIILTPQVVIMTVGMSLLWSAALILLSLTVFSYRSNAKVANEYMPMIYQYGLFLLVGLIIFSLFMNPANIGMFMLIDGLITSALFSVFLVLDVFKAAYMTEITPHPVMMAMTIYLDILNIVLGVLEMRAGEEINKNNQSSTLGMSLFGFLLPIMFGIYLVYDAFWGADNSGVSPSTGSDRFSSKNIPLESDYSVNSNDMSNDYGNDRKTSCSIM